MTNVERKRRKLIVAVREMVELLSAAELGDLIEHIKEVMRTTQASKPPIVIVKDMKTYRAEDIPDEYLAAIAKELKDG